MTHMYQIYRSSRMRLFEKLARRIPKWWRDGDWGFGNLEVAYRRQLHAGAFQNGVRVEASSLYTKIYYARVYCILEKTVALNGGPYRKQFAVYCFVLKQHHMIKLHTILVTLFLWLQMGQQNIATGSNSYKLLMYSALFQRGQYPVPSEDNCS